MSGRWLALLSRLGRRGSAAATERVVLVLQGDLALWTRWRDGRCVAERPEPLETEVAATVCPWPLEGETCVDVVADSPLDDIERVLASGEDRPSATGAGPLARFRRRLLALQLARHHPHAQVRTAPPSAAPLLATLLQAELPESWRRRLETLQRGPVVVRVLHSAIRLRESVADERVGEVLSIFPGGGVERHLLYRFGCPTFTRVVTAADARASRAALDETLAHLAASHGVVAPREYRHRELDSASDVGDEAGDESSGVGAAARSVCDADDARRLAALALGSTRRSRPGASPPVLLDKQQRRTELRRLHLFTVLTAVIAALTVFAGAVHGIDGVRRRGAAAAAEEALLLRMDHLDEAIGARHAMPTRADASLALIERREASRGPDAAALLGMLAGVLTNHPGIGLDRLAWTTPEPDSESGESSPGAAAALPPRDIDEAERAPVARLELAGRIDVGEGSPVRARQRRFEAFVAALERSAGVTELEVRLSPASAAATRGESGDGPARIDYELRLRYARSG